MEFQAVILAAGKGSRMTELTATKPKALLPVGNKPMIWYPINLLEKAGFEEVIIVALHDNVRDINQVLKELCGTNLKLNFEGIPDNDWGTAESLRFIKDKIKTDVLVMSCDVITDVSLHHLADLYRTHDATITMLLSTPPQPSAEGAAAAATPGGKSRKTREQKDIIGLGDNSRLLMLLAEADLEDSITVRKSVLKKHPCINIHTTLLDGHMFLMKKWVINFLVDHKSISSVKSELVPYLVKRQFHHPKPPSEEQTKDSAIVPTAQYPQDIYSYGAEDRLTVMARKWSSFNDHAGDMDDCYHDDTLRCYAYVRRDGFCLRTNTLGTYVEANRQMPKQLPTLVGANIEETLVHPTASLTQRSQIGQDCMIGQDTTVANKVSIKKSIIGKHCKIEEKVKISNSVIMDHVTIKEGCSIQGCVISDNVHINEQSEINNCVVGGSQTLKEKSKFTNEVLVEKEALMEI